MGAAQPLRWGMLLARDQGILRWLFKGWGSGRPWAGGIPFSGGAGCDRVPLLHNEVKWLFSSADWVVHEGALEKNSCGESDG